MNENFAIGGCPADKQLFTGSGNCDVHKGYIKTLLVTKQNAKYEVPADGNLDAIIKESVGLPFAHPNKMWIVSDIITNGAPEGGDNITSSAGERGGSHVVGQNPMSVTYSVKHSMCKQAAMLKFKGLNVRVMEIDENKKVFGIAEDVNGTRYLKGYKANLWVSTTPATASADALINVMVAHDVNYFTEEQPYESNGIIETAPKALQSAQLVKTGVGRAKLLSPCSSEDLGAIFGSLLDKTAFIAKSGIEFDVTFDATASEYVFTTTFDVPIPNIDEFKLAPVADLYALNVLDVEGIDTYVSLDSTPTAERKAQLVKSATGIATIAAIGLPAMNVGEVLGDMLTRAAFVAKTAVDFTVTFDSATNAYTFMTTDAVPVPLADEVKLADKSVLLGLGILGIVGDGVFVDLA